MKRNRIIFALLLALLTVALGMLAGCKQAATTDTVDDCMSKFKTAVNTQTWSDLKGLTLTTAAQHNLMSDSIWQGIFLATNFSYTVSGDSASATCGVLNYAFTLTKDIDDNYRVQYIDEIVGSSTTRVFK
jgi:hypothetical protein